MRRKVRLSLGVLAGLLLIAAVGSLFGGDTTPAPASAPTTDAVEGYRVAIDPVTHEFVEPQAVEQPVMKAPEGALSQSAEGLVQQDAPVGGGKMVHLQGRFQNTFTAVVGDGGKMKIECTTDAAEDGGEE